MVIITPIIVCNSSSLFSEVKTMEPKEQGFNIFHIPHPDDEALFMAKSIYRSHIEGKNNILVLYSHGKASKAKDTLNVSEDKLGELRVKEFISCAEVLGLHPDNTYIYDLDDGNFNPNTVYEILNKLIDDYPNAEHNTMTYFDTHRDHAIVGKALKQLLNNSRIKKCKFYIANYDYSLIDMPSYNVISTQESLNMKRQVLDIYKIGKISVPDLWEF